MINTTRQLNNYRYALYCRKSSESEERQALSIDSQKHEADRLFSNLNITAIFEESKSAFKIENRPEFKKMLEMLKRQEIDGVIAYHPDRLSRNEVDAASVTYLIRTGVIKDLKFISYNFDNTPEGLMMLQFLLSQSQYYSSKLGREVKRGATDKLALGWRPGVAPIGYLNTPDREKGYKIIVDDPERFHIVRSLWDLMLTGNYTVPQIWEISRTQYNLTTVKRKKLGGHYISKSGMYALLTNPFYYGWFTYAEKTNGNAELHKGNHNPMITKDEFDRVQSLLGKKTAIRPKEKQFAFTGLMKCGNCGCSITAEDKVKRNKNGNVHNYIYYHCTKKKTDVKCLERCVEAKKLEIEVQNVLNKITISDEFKNWAIKYLHEVRTNEAQGTRIAIKQKTKQLEKITEKIQDLSLSYTSTENNDKGILTTDEYKVLKNKLIKEKIGIEESLQKEVKEVEDWVELTEKTFNFALYAKVWFENGDDQTKKAILACLGSNLYIKDKKLFISLHEFVKPFIQEQKQPRVETVHARTSKKSMIQTQNAALGDVCTTWLPGSDSNRRPIGYTYPLIS